MAKAKDDAKQVDRHEEDEVVPWEDFRGCLDAVWRRSDKARKSRAGRKPWDAVVMFKTIILSALYNLSDDQVEHQTRDAQGAKALALIGILFSAAAAIIALLVIYL